MALPNFFRLVCKRIEEHSKRNIQAISVCLIAISVQWLCLIAQLNNGALCLINKPRSSENKFHHGVGRTAQYIKKILIKYLKIYATVQIEVIDDSDLMTVKPNSV